MSDTCKYFLHELGKSSSLKNAITPRNKYALQFSFKHYLDLWRSLMRALIVGTIALLFSANLAWADVVATWKMSDGAVSKLSIRDNQHVRIDTNEKDTYMLLTNQKVHRLPA